MVRSPPSQATAPTALDPAKPAQEQAARRLESLLAEGVLTPDQPLPSERELAGLLGVSRPTLRAVLGSWRERGRLRAFGRRGWVLAEQATTASAAALGDSVLVVSPAPLSPETALRGPGFTAAIQVGAIEALHAADLAALSLRPGQLDGGRGDARLTRILAQRPYGVLAFVDGELEAAELAAIERILERCRAAGCACVAYAAASELAGLDRVRSDHAAGAAALTRALLAEGRRRIQRLWLRRPGATARPWLRERDRGHAEAMAAAGLDVLPLRVVELPPERVADAAGFERRARHAAGFLLELREDPPDAICCPSDNGAMIVAEALRLLGLDPVEQVRVVGYDHSWRETEAAPFSSFVPALTVDKDNRRIGAELIALLRARIAGELPPEPQLVDVPPRLIDLRRPG